MNIYSYEKKHFYLNTVGLFFKFDCFIFSTVTKLIFLWFGKCNSQIKVDFIKRLLNSLMANRKSELKTAKNSPTAKQETTKSK